MATDDSGDVFAQQGGPPAWSGADGWNGIATDSASENQTSHTENSDQQKQESSVSIEQAPSAGDDSNDEDGGEYDPESVTIPVAPAPIVERPASDSPRPSKKPKTAGGFIVNSSDEEDDDVPAPAPNYPPVALKPVPSEAQAQPFTHSPIQQLQQTSVSQDMANYAPAQVSSDPAPKSSSNPASAAAATRSRLPADTVGILEDRITEDPRGDLEAWLALIDEQKKRHKIDETRSVYERFLTVFPQAAEIWATYIDMELSLDNTKEAESIFTRTLRAIPHVQLWTTYLNYIRRRNDLNDPTGRARQTVSQSYEFVLSSIGQDRDAGNIWQDYIQFLKAGPGQIGGAGWQDQQKMDLLRKAYQRAISIPMANLNLLWKEYDQFEMGLNKMTGRKFLQERSPSYMTARSANTHLENITRGLQRTTLPRLPPASGFGGSEEYQEQVRLWKAWIAWEKSDPLVLKSDDPNTYQQRILHTYKQSLMALRFWPEMWVDAAEWCFESNIISPEGQDVGLQFLVEGSEANPESSLLALKHADRIESTQAPHDDDVDKAALVQSIRAPCDQVLETLYNMIKKLKDRETTTIARYEEDAALNSTATGNEDGDEEDEGEINEKPSADAINVKSKIKAVQDGFAAQIQMLSQHISYIWIALARIYRRLQGQGHGKSTPPVGMRGLFIEARQRGRLTSDVYLEIAHMEWDVYQDDVATKIFERGAKLFPEQEHFIVEYLKHLHVKRDFTNARVVFSQTVKRFKEKSELTPKLKPIYAYFHGYEAQFGELAQVKELEKQMTELFPEDTSLAHFAARFSTDRFNPITARVIVSPAKQMRPKIMQSVEQISLSSRSTPRQVPQIERSPLPQFAPLVNSPKRPFPQEDQDDYPPRKLARGVSPLKGAAGRRLDQQRRAQGQGTSSHTAGPYAHIPRDLLFLLGLIPTMENLGGYNFNMDRVVRLIQNTFIPPYSEWKAQKDIATRNTAQSHAHTRPASSEYQSYPHTNRDSPGPSARPASPFAGANRGIGQASAPYRNSPLRPGSSGSYEPPPAVYQAPGMTQFNPLAQNSAQGNAAFAAWQNGAYAPPQYNTGATQHPQQYGGFY